jgi:DNA-binding MarR family transcriptional regulator
MLDKLQKKDLIRRDRRNPTDQRVVELNLTEKGVTLLAKAPRPAQGVLADVLLRLPDENLDHLEIGLKEFVKILKSSDQKDGFKPLDL